MVSTTRPYNDSRNLARTGLGYDGVVRITNGSFYGTGALLEDGIHILTAAHVAKGLAAGSVSVVFETSVGQQAVSVSRITIYSSYDAANANGDLALLTLSSSAPVTADRYAPYRQTDELGQVGVLAGYGAPAMGSTGVLGIFESPTRRVGENRLDATVDQLAAGYSADMAWHPATGAQLAADFDNGQAANDAFGRLMGKVDTGLGDDEASISPGDSGGPLFVQGKLAGVASYSFRLATSTIIPDIDSTANASFGEFAAWQRVSYYAQWLDQTLRAEQSGAPTKPSEVKKTVVEGNSGTTLAWFLVSLSHPAKGGEQIKFHTVDGTAKANVDYLPMSDAVVFYAGEDHVAIPVEVLGNTRVDGDRTFGMVITDPVGGVFPGGVTELTATRTIIDDDGPVALVGVAGGQAVG